MLKRLTVAVAALFVLASSAFGAGTVPGFSLTPQFDLTGKVMPGCKLYIIQAGTTSTPQIAYQDSALTLPVSGGSTLACDAAGRLPLFWLADGSIKLRLTKSDGTQVFAQDGIAVIGASSGGGGGSPVDATTILATGDVKTRYGTGILTGFVRANGRTIGSATSGATERANSDCQSLFEYLWGADANLAVSTGRGASANADWVANKTIALPDGRGRVLAGLDDMGNSAAGRLTSTYFGTSAIVLGAVGGAESRALTLAQLPTGITTSGSVALQSGFFFTKTNSGSFTNGNLPNTGTLAAPVVSSGAWSLDNTIPGTFTSTNTSGNAHATVQPTMLATIYLKL